MPQDGTATWRFTAEESGMYAVEVTYQALAGKTTDVEAELRLNGGIPYEEAGFIHLQRIWKDAETPSFDNNGNERKPAQTEVFDWRTVDLRDTYSWSDSYIKLYLQKGENTISLSCTMNGCAVAGIRLGDVLEHPPTYSELKASYAAAGYRAAGSFCMVRQAEKTLSKSQSGIAQQALYSDASATPSDPAKVRYNALGGESWKYSGESVTWQIDVPENGLYQLGFKYIQDYIQGFSVYRQIAVDGKVPCTELEAVAFPYCTNWKNKILTDENGDPMSFYLTKGTHTLTLTVV